MSSEQFLSYTEELVNTPAFRHLFGRSCISSLIFIVFLLDFWPNLAPFWEPKWKQNGVQNASKSKTKKEMQKIPLQDPLGAVFDQCWCAAILKSRAPVRGKRTFSKMRFFATNFINNQFCVDFGSKNASKMLPFGHPKPNKKRTKKGTKNKSEFPQKNSPRLKSRQRGSSYLYVQTRD